MHYANQSIKTKKKYVLFFFSFDGLIETYRKFSAHVMLQILFSDILKHKCDRIYNDVVC